MSRNQYHAPLSKDFSFASNGSIAKTLQTGFSQSGGQFSEYQLPVNTPFWASALTGHLTWQRLYKLQNSSLNPNKPFLGNPTTNPYVGQGPVASTCKHAVPRSGSLQPSGIHRRARRKQRACSARDSVRCEGTKQLIFGIG